MEWQVGNIEEDFSDWLSLFISELSRSLVKQSSARQDYGVVFDSIELVGSVELAPLLQRFLEIVDNSCKVSEHKEVLFEGELIFGNSIHGDMFC